MRESVSNNRRDRRDFITQSLASGAFVGMGCPGLLAMSVQQGVSNPTQDKHKFQTATDFTYEQLFNFAFRSWFISYMKRLQEEIGTAQFLALLTKAGDKHYQSRVKSNFEKIENKSVQSLIENFWEQAQRSKFANTIMTIEIPEKLTDKATVKITDCLFATTFRGNDAGDIGYAAICHADFAVVEEFNPDIKLTRNQCLMNGDKYCLFEYTLNT